ncbi:hypothetical protein ABGB17_31120 [Sphaerisporangium sp. B11E5]|uniref:hypothetical protein n=1 Tax=Sphaerisporangium sp. B11E5 TaxID=3153563 RepID=UPI00325E32E6
MRHRHVMPLAAAATFSLAAACGGPEPPPPVPEPLIGAWLMITERGNAFSYDLLADGRYRYNAIMPDGSLRYTLQEAGGFSVSGTRVTFTPRTSILTRTDPKDPVEPSVRSTPRRPPRTYTWAVAGDVLTLTSPDGASRFRRE